MNSRLKLLSNLKIASAENIGAFIKNHRAYCENHTKDQPRSELADHYRTEMSMDRSRNNSLASSKSSPSKMRVQIDGNKGNAELSMAVESGDI